ncbi:hypothetical protein ASG59_11805 [Methylobacterium sp. Leaf466]|nr:hypothetical protein ASG59_11805 [Methylobacterium sp. Leaf466]
MRSQLTDFAASAQALRVFEASFGIGLDRPQVEDQLARWQAGDFTGAPKIAFADEGSLNGARAAYSQGMGTIYLSTNWALDSARTAGEVARVIIEEIGHALDARLNGVDTAGDEGELFSALVFGGGGVDARRLAVIRAEDDSGTISIDGQVLSVEQAAGDIVYEKLLTYSDGISQALTSIENALANKVFAQALPLFGDDLNSAFTATSSAATHALRGVRSFKDAVQGAIDNAIAGGSNGTPYSGTNIANAINNALSNAGFLGSPVSFNTTNGEWSFNNTGIFMLNTQPLSNNLGLGPGNLLQLTSTATANIGLAYGIALTIGSDTNTSGFYIRGDTANELSLNLSASTLNLGGGVQVGGLQLFSANVATDPARPTNFTANFALDLRDGQNGTTNDGKIYIGEMGTAGFQILNPTVSGGLNLNVDLRTLDSLEGVVKIETDFGVNWNFAGSTNGLFGSAPVVSFKNTDVAFLSFLTEVLLPFVTNVKAGIEPIRDILDILKADIGALSNMPGGGADFLDVVDEDNGFVAGQDGTISLLDIAKFKNMAGIDTALTLFPILDAVVTWYDFLTGPLASTGLMSVGDFTITDDIRDATFVLSGANASVTGAVDDLHDFIDAQFAPSAAATLGNMLSNGPAAPNKIIAPILTDAQEALGYLFGRNTDILKFNLPKVGFSFGSGIEPDGSFNGSLSDIFNIPIFLPGLNIEVEAALRAIIDIDFGYDTRGISQYILSGSFLPGANTAPDPTKLLNGFFITDWDENGQERPELVLGAQINFGVGAGIDGLLKAFAGGAIEGVVNLDIIDGGGANPQDGKVHYDEFVAALSSPLNLFEGRGLITAGMIAYVEHLFGTHEWRSPMISLASFNFGGQGSAFDPGLATPDEPNNALTLNIGVNAGLRLIDNKLDGNEQFSIVAGPGVGRFTVIAFGHQQSFDDVGSIDGVAGSGNDIIAVDENLTTAVDFAGGDGEDVLYGGAGTDTLAGGDNSDYLVGAGGADDLDGGDNDDVLDGGAGADTLDGGGGIDLVTYVRSTVSIGVNLGNGATSGGDSTGDVLISIENVVGADVAGAGDTIFGIDGGTVANVINGLKGNDNLYGGGGDDTLIGGDGNDTVDGGLGADVLSGGQGDDTYGVNSLLDVIDENRFGGGSGRDRIISAIDINIEALTDIEELQLFGSARVGEGNHLANLIIGTTFNDTLRGRAGIDTIKGGVGADMLEGEADADDLQGEAGNDTLVGGAGNDSMAGGLESDTYIVADAGDVVSELVGQGTDTVHTSVNYVLTAGSEVESIETINAAATTPLELGGNAFAQRLTANVGDNVLEGYAGADTLDGGSAGFDIASYEHASAAISFNLTTGAKTGDAGGDIFIAIDAFRGTAVTSVGDSMTGGGAGDNFNGLAGNDSLLGLGGADTLFGGLGNDTLDGGLGDDILGGGTGDDTYRVDSLLDVVDDDRTAYTNGGGGRDIIITGLNYNLGASADRNDIEDLTITGTARSATGNALGNLITGTDGNDTIDGAGGADDLRGGWGNDLYFLDSAADRVVENANAGTDEIRVATAGFYNVGPAPDFTQSPYAIDMQVSWLVNIEDVVLLDNGRLVHLTGNALGNRLVSNDQSSSLTGGLGGDTLVTGQGRDVAAGGDGLDTLIVDWSMQSGVYDFTTFSFVGSLADGYSGRYADVYNGSSGYNLVDFTGVERFNVAVGTTNDYVLTGDGDDTVSGGAGQKASTSSTVASATIAGRRTSRR